MSPLACPRCATPVAGPVTGSQLVCAACGHTWHTVPPRPPSEILRSDEYLPDEPGSGLQQARRALTERKEAPSPRLGELSETGLPELPSLPNPAERDDGFPPAAPTASAPPLPPAPAAAAARAPVESTPIGRDPSARRGIANDPAVGPTIDSRLFERLERDSQERRSKLATAPDLDPLAEPSGGVPVIDGARSCPVCGAAVSVAGKGKRRGCAQCGTVFDSVTGAPLGRGASEQDPLIGRTLRGCLIDRRLGEGGMGTVYHARQLSLDRSVAVKVLPVDLGRNKNFIQRFEREAKSLARINHPNILQIYDFGEDPQLGIYFMVIEFVPGLDLGEVINRRGLLGQLEVLDMVRQALSGLEAAAEKGVIHRDIKPDNLMIGENGLVKVSDFGLAKGYVAQIGVTAAGVRVGTPAFMSPEQCDGTEVDSRSDIYNLGASAYLCLTGRLPFDGDSPFAIMLKHKAEPVPSMLTHDPGIDPRIDAIICRMMAKKPDDRCGSLRELIEEVEALETQLAGTDSVLRKSRGPFRALVASVRGGTENFPLVDDLEVVDEPTLMEASAGSAGAPHLSSDLANITPPPLALPVARPGAVRPGSGLRPSREPSPGLDLARTDTDPGGVGIRGGNGGTSGGSPSRWGLPAAITPEPAPKTGRITLSQRAIDAPAGSSASGSYAARGSASGVRPATASINRRTASVQAMPLPTPPPGLEPLASGRPVTGGTSRLGRSIRDSQVGLSSRRGEASLNEARDRGRRAEIEALSNNAERLQAEGLLAEAAREFNAAADAAAGLPDEPAFRRRARSATRRDLLRTTIRRAVIAASLSLALVAAILLTVPKGHSLVADRRLAVVRENLVQVAPASQQAANLRAFARECEPLGWYVATFRRGYPLPARDAALAQADEIDARIRLERQKVAVIPLDTKAIEAFGNDPQVPWADVQLQGEAFLAKVTIEHHQEPGVLRVADLTATAKAQQAAASLSVAAVAQTRATGDHRAALALADQVRRQFPRIPPVVAAMPQPGQVLVEIPGLSLPTDLTLTVDRVPVALTAVGSTSNGQLAQAVIARNPAGDTVIEATASGFNPARMALPANASSDKPARLGLRHATLWTLRALPAQTPWAQIEPVAGGLLVRHRDGLLRLRSTDGAVLATVTRQTQQPGYARGALGVSGTRLLIPRENGTVLAFPPDLSAPGDLLHEGRGELTAWLDTEFTLRPGRKLRVVVEDLGPTQQVSALDGRTALWSYQALKGRLPAGLIRHDDRLIAIDDANLHVLEEDGRCAGVFALPGRRTGPVMPLGTLGSRSQVLVPTASGPVRLAFGGRQDPVRALADPVLASIGSATAGRLGDDLCLAGATNLTLVQLGVRSVQVWQQPLTAPSVFAPVLGAKLVVTVDPAGTLLLRDQASGAIQRSIVHGTPLLTPPLVLDTGSIIVLDRNGLVTAYR